MGRNGRSHAERRAAVKGGERRGSIGSSRSAGRGRAVHSRRFAGPRVPKRSPTSSSTHCGGARARLLPSAPTPSHGRLDVARGNAEHVLRRTAEPRALRNGCRHLDREFYERGRRSHKRLRCLSRLAVVFPPSLGTYPTRDGNAVEPRLYLFWENGISSI